MVEIGKTDRRCYEVCNDVIVENREPPYLFLTEHGMEELTCVSYAGGMR
jgi:hypothetical protein